RPRPPALRRGGEECPTDRLLRVDGSVFRVIEALRWTKQLCLPALPELTNSDRLDELVAHAERGIEGVDRLLEDHPDARPADDRQLPSPDRQVVQTLQDDPPLADARGRLEQEPGNRLTKGACPATSFAVDADDRTRR